MTTTIHIRLHYTDKLAWGRDPIDEQLAMPRTMWFEGDIDLPGVREGWGDLDICEHIWRAFNRVDGSAVEHPVMDEIGLRSMCVGDVIEIRTDYGPRFYIAADFGFEPVEGVRSKEDAR